MGKLETRQPFVRSCEMYFPRGKAWIVTSERGESKNVPKVTCLLLKWGTNVFFIHPNYVYRYWSNLVQTKASLSACFPFPLRLIKTGTAKKKSETLFRIPFSDRFY